ncbi:helix-turn-helix domain-containing protein [uncultured Cetobacterium sp.]|uniref:helix-turn-helix domain-containing protein n=1 Tax=uncultured Cetobacterium sp. TaxID=527638 RepID=UPI0026346ED9|nr:helix-turn-helix domain-containing protein [uncultured Cetobacterium sp.]
MKTSYEKIDEFGDHFGVSQLMDILNQSESSIRRLIQKKTIPFYFTSNTYYFKKNHIKFFLGQEAL